MAIECLQRCARRGVPVITLLPLLIIAPSFLAANLFPLLMNRQAVAAQINRPLPYWTRYLTASSSGQLATEKVSQLNIFNDRTSARSCKIIRMLFPSSHPSSASTTRIYAHYYRYRLALIADEEQVDATARGKAGWQYSYPPRCFANVPIDSRYAVCKPHGMLVTNLQAW
jgi:hypothetical protein